MSKRIAILTGGGDVPGLNAAIKAFVGRLLDHDGYEILGLRRGWASLLNIIPEPDADNSAWITPLGRINTRSIDRFGGTMLHTSRINPSISKLEHIPAHLLSLKGEPDEGGFWATCLEVSGANGQGETRQECLANLKDEFFSESTTGAT